MTSGFGSRDRKCQIVVVTDPAGDDGGVPERDGRGFDPMVGVAAGGSGRSFAAGLDCVLPVQGLYNLFCHKENL